MQRTWEYTRPHAASGARDGRAPQRRLRRRGLLAFDRARFRRKERPLMGFREVGLSESEYKRIQELLGREPNDLELELIGVMWSEHCSYKSTRPLLRTFPSKGKYVLQGQGENAGVVDMGEVLGLRLQGREPQPPLRGRALPGSRDGSRRHHPRHHRDGRAPVGFDGRTFLRRRFAAQDAEPRQGHRRGHRLLRQLRRRSDGRRQDLLFALL